MVDGKTHGWLKPKPARNEETTDAIRGQSKGQIEAFHLPMAPQ